MNFKIVLLIFTFIFSVIGNAQNIIVKDVNYKKISNKNIRIKIKLNTEYDILPMLSLKNNTVQLIMPEAFVKKTIKKNIQFESQKATLSAYQSNQNRTKIQFSIPKSVAVIKNKKNIKIKVIKNNIFINIPLLFSKKNKRIIATKFKKSKYDESYLDKLLKSDRKIIAKNNKAKVGDNNINSNILNKDTINIRNSSIKKNPKFSVMSYLGKFVAFLSILLIGFYGVFALLKKGAFGKNKLGFLNSTKIVEVLSNTYIGPKKNLILVKAHNQVFLVGSSDHGLQLISEVADTAGILKSGEKSLSGTNFDTNIHLAESDKKDFKLKEVLDQSTPVNLNDGKVNRFKDQLKEKVKGLKSMQ